jgi:magnesium transporter
MRSSLSVVADAGLDELKEFFDAHAFLGVPVTDDAGILLGVVRRARVAEAFGERATETFLAVSGLIGEDELRTMPVLLRARRRLSWLSINIVLNVVAASVIAFYEDTLAAVIALAVFLPIISDMSGCSGNQAVAVSIRELTLGLVRPYEFLRIVFKEGAVGLINGVVLGGLLGTVAVIWKGNLYLGLVVGSALMFNTLLAVLLGGLIPLALKAAKQDPALASGPILTTVTDLVGFFLVLSFATVMLTFLV